MSHWFHIRPWELDLLTDAEVSAYRAALADIKTQNEKGG